jgi:hypothetical protein
MSTDFAADTRPMTPAQMRYIRDLATSRDITAEDRTRLMGLLDQHALDIETQSLPWASTVIDWLKRRDRLETPVTVAPAAPEQPLVIGVYQFQGAVYVVKPDRKSGALGAYRVVEIGGQRLTRQGETVEFELRYARGVINSLSLRHRMPLVDAEALMIRYSRCICCGRHLKDATSVKEGIGPVCRSRYFD